MLVLSPRRCSKQICSTLSFGDVSLLVSCHYELLRETKLFKIWARTLDKNWNSNNKQQNVNGYRVHASRQYLSISTKNDNCISLGAAEVLLGKQQVENFFMNVQINVETLSIVLDAPGIRRRSLRKTFRYSFLSFKYSFVNIWSGKKIIECSFDGVCAQTLFFITRFPLWVYYFNIDPHPQCGC